MSESHTILHRPTGRYLHIRRFNEHDQPLTTDDIRKSWVGSREQAIAQADFLEPDGEWVAAELPGCVAGGRQEIAD